VVQSGSKWFKVFQGGSRLFNIVVQGSKIKVQEVTVVAVVLFRQLLWSVARNNFEQL
jgi:hypothetical protein